MTVMVQADKKVIPYHEVLRQRHRRSWLLAAIVATLANIVLFLLMPALIAPSQVKPEAGPEISHINVIRMKRPEQVVKKRKPVEPEKPQERQKPVKSTAPQSTLEVKTPLLQLPFEIDQRLPSLATDIQLPPAAVGPVQQNGPLGAVEMELLDAPLTPLSRIPPIYPRVAQRRGIEGWVKVRFLVTQEGRVEQIEILEASPSDIFNRSVRQCLASWRFNPGTVEGVPVSAWMQTTFQFELDQ